MRLQGMSIVFALVALPIILVIAYYISLQIDTITLQNDYNNKLLTATHNAMAAFELNTANEDLSSVSDSLRTIIEASDNVFMNSLASSLGMSNASKSYLEPYIPSILYTMYDGYYIYTPTYTPTVITDSKGNAVSVGDLGVTIASDGGYNFNEIKKEDDDGKAIELKFDKEEPATLNTDKINKANPNQVIDYGQLLYYSPKTKKTVNSDGTFSYTNCTTSTTPAKNNDTTANNAKYKTKNVLKSYMPYSARYVQKDLKDSEGNTFSADLNLIYTLDNYITIDGSFTYKSGATIYYTKSGYLVPFTADSKLSVKVELIDNSGNVVKNFTDALEYNQNEMQEYIEAGNPIRISVLKNLNKENITDSDYETIIEIKNDNRAIIDSTNTNSNSDTVKLVRYENILFDLEEVIASLRKVADKDTIISLFKKDDLGNIINDDAGISVKSDYGNAIYNALTILSENNEFDKELEFDKYKDKKRDELLGLINSENLISRIKEIKVNPTKYRIQLNSAAVYYAKSAIFSNWVMQNLKDLDTNSITDISGLNYTTYTESLVNEATGDENNYLNVWKSEGKLFNFSPNTKIKDKENTQENYGSTEIRKDSEFYNHKLAIIRNSIQYNLNLAMSSYNRHVYYADDDENYAFNKNTDYAMPILKESEWEQITNNISIVSFMQGFKCKLKYYNGYAIVSSSNNEIVTTPENIYYVQQSEFNNEMSDYHKYNCKKVIEIENKKHKENEGKAENEKDIPKYISFTSKEIKYDKMSTSSTLLPYAYDHRNFACYDCINDGNYNGPNIFDIEKSEFESETYKNLRKSFYIGVAKERNDVYKMNAVKKSEGYEIIYEPLGDKYKDKNRTSTLDIDKIKEIEIVFGAIDIDERDETSLTFSARYKGTDNTERNLKNQPGTSDPILYSIPTNTNNNYTWRLEVDSNISSTGKFMLKGLLFYNQNPTSRYNGNIKDAIKCIRIIYK